MPISTQYFSVSIEDENLQGIYCAYCGKKIMPTRDKTSTGFIFQCTCEDAKRERDLYEQKTAAESKLKAFLENKSDVMQINELRTRIAVYEQHITEMKKRLRALINETTNVEENNSDASELHTDSTQSSTQKHEELDTHTPTDLDNNNEPSEVLDTTVEDAEAQQKALEDYLKSVDLGNSENLFRLDDVDSGLLTLSAFEETELNDKPF